MNESYYFLFVLMGYFTGFVFYFLNFETSNRTGRAFAAKITWTILALHLCFFLLHYLRTGEMAVHTLAEYFYILSFIILLVSFYIESRFDARFLMLFSLPVVMILCLLALLLTGRERAGLLSLDSWWLKLHTGLMLAGFAGLITAVSAALMYLIQSRQLKSKHIGNASFKLPPLETLDRVHFRALVWGVILFSLGILCGFFSARDRQELMEVLKDPKVDLSFAACAAYWVILGLRLSSLRRGQKIAGGTVLVFILLFAILAGVYFTPQGFHKGY